MTPQSKREEAAWLGEFAKIMQACAGVYTDRGTPAMWRAAERAGLVTKAHSFMGHRFAYNITAKGRAVLAERERGRG
jgi:hypothetical protein